MAGVQDEDANKREFYVDGEVVGEDALVKSREYLASLGAL